MMRNFIILCCLFIASISQAVQTPNGGNGGGSVVGNGAGLVENNFQYAYMSLFSLTTSCLQKDCGFTSDEINIVKQIQNVLAWNKTNSKRIIFVSSVMFPGLFDTEPEQKHRVAVTGLTEKEPIYVNTDRLYTKTGEPAFDYSTIISILVHELGHQAGIKDHAQLDILGSKFKREVLRLLSHYKTDLGPEEKALEVLIINHSTPYHRSEIFVSLEGQGSVKMTERIMSSLRCKDSEASLSGFSMSNGHFQLTGSSQTKMEFGLWVHLHCFSSQNKTMKIEKRAVRFEVNTAFDIHLLPTP